MRKAAEADNPNGQNGFGVEGRLVNMKSISNNCRPLQGYRVARVWIHSFHVEC